MFCFSFIWPRSNAAWARITSSIDPLRSADIHWIIDARNNSFKYANEKSSVSHTTDAAPLCVTGFILASYFAALGALDLLVRVGAWPGVDWKAPFFLFVLLVSIGADYGVFVLGRAREEARALPYDAAIARALEATGPVVTSCGVVLAGTFATLLVTRIAFPALRRKPVSRSRMPPDPRTSPVS